MTLGHWLKQYREQHDISQPQLADSIGIEQSYLSKLENDKSLPSADVFDAIINATQTTLEKLLTALDGQYVYNQLAKLPQVKSHLVNQKQQNQQNTSKRLTLFGLLLCFGCFLFYLGHSQAISSNQQYHYYSGGILKADEPLETLDRGWARHLTDEQYYRRFSPNSIIISTYRGNGFEVNNSDGRRYFSKSGKGGKDNQETVLNRWLKAIGVLVFSGGFFGVILLVINRKVLGNE